MSKEASKFMAMHPLEAKARKIANYCRSYRCAECINWQKFLTCNTMHTICWNKDKHFEPLNIHQP